MPIHSAQAVFNILKNKVSFDTEEFWVLALSPNKSLLRSKMLFRGTVDSCLIHPRDIFRFACIENASSIIIAHNHPSQDPLPSDEDIEVTKNLLAISRLIQIPIVDHLIITLNDYTSLAQERIINFESKRSYFEPPEFVG